MPRAFQIILYILLGYLFAAGLAYFLISQYSGNKHDRAMEAIMSAIFIAGPIGAVIGGVVGFVKTG